MLADKTIVLDRLKTYGTIHYEFNQPYSDGDISINKFLTGTNVVNPGMNLYLKNRT